MNKRHEIIKLGCLYYNLWVCISSDAQGLLLLALHSDIMPSRAQGTVWDAGDGTQVGQMQSKSPKCCSAGLSGMPFAICFSFYQLPYSLPRALVGFWLSWENTG